MQDAFLIPESEISETFIRASGPGGQNVNKVATAVQLRFDVRASRVLPEEVKRRLLKLAGARATDDGVIILEGRRFRSQERNRADVRERLAALVGKAATRPKKRIATKPSTAQKRARLDDKKKRSAIKDGRRSVRDRD